MSSPKKPFDPSDILSVPVDQLYRQMTQGINAPPKLNSQAITGVVPMPTVPDWALDAQSIKGLYRDRWGRYSELTFNVEFTDYEVRQNPRLRDQRDREQYAIRAFSDKLRDSIVSTARYSEKGNSGRGTIRGMVTVNAIQLGAALMGDDPQAGRDKALIASMLATVKSRIEELDARDDYQDDVRADELRDLLSKLEQEADA